MNTNLANASTIFGLGVALYRVVRIVPVGWQQMAVFVGMVVYTTLGLVGVIHWARNDGKVLRN